MWLICGAATAGSSASSVRVSADPAQPQDRAAQETEGTEGKSTGAQSRRNEVSSIALPQKGHYCMLLSGDLKLSVIALECAAQ